MGGQRTFPLQRHLSAWHREFGMEEQHVLLDNLRVADKDTLSAGCQRTERLDVTVAARDVAPEVVDVLRRVLAQAAAQRSRPIWPLRREQR